MNSQITVNMDNLSEIERSQLMQMIEKANKPKSRIWKPRYIEQYYYVAGDGDARRDTWVDHDMDHGRWDSGNVYKTVDQARLASEKQRVLSELQRYADEHNDWSRATWGELRVGKCCIAYNHLSKQLTIIERYNNHEDTEQIYFTSVKTASDALTEVGKDRILKYLFGMEGTNNG